MSILSIVTLEAEDAELQAYLQRVRVMNAPQPTCVRRPLYVPPSNVFQTPRHSNAPLENFYTYPDVIADEEEG